MATVRIPPVLRPSVGGEKEVSADGESVGAVLHALAEAHPATRGQLFSDEGELDGLETSVSNGDTLVILPAMAGG